VFVIKKGNIRKKVVEGKPSLIPEERKPRDTKEKEEKKKRWQRFFGWRGQKKICLKKEMMEQN